MKPRLTRYGAGWMCWSPAIFGSRIVGFGPTAEEAFTNWERTAKE
jgi:hypothetical protein